MYLIVLSVQPRKMLCESLNIVEHYRNLALAFGVIADLHEFSCFDTTEATAAEVAAEQAKLLAEIKEKKDSRRESIDRTMLTVIEFIADIFKVTVGELVESIVDSETKTECLHRFFSQNATDALILSFTQIDDVNQFDILHEKEYIQTDQCVVVYRTDSPMDITLKNMSNVS